MLTATPPLDGPVLIARNLFKNVQALLVLHVSLPGIDRVLARLKSSPESRAAIDADKLFPRARAYKLDSDWDFLESPFEPSPALSEFIEKSDCYGLPAADLPREVLAELDEGPQMGTVLCKVEDGRIIFGVYIQHFGICRLAAVEPETWLKLRCRMVDPAERPRAFGRLLAHNPDMAALWLLDGCRIGTDPEGSCPLGLEDVARTPEDLVPFLASENHELRLQALALVGRFGSPVVGEQEYSLLTF